MKFLLITEGNGRVGYINGAHVAAFSWDETEKVTDVVFINGDTIEVKETPEDLFNGLMHDLI